MKSKSDDTTQGTQDKGKSPGKQKRIVQIKDEDLGEFKPITKAKSDMPPTSGGNPGKEKDAGISFELSDDEELNEEDSIWIPKNKSIKKLIRNLKKVPDCYYNVLFKCKIFSFNFL
ncbi:MAG: hypothetical protein MJ252_29835 [archaeon]|nr:hypothetical protein [archaeon]